MSLTKHTKLFEFEDGDSGTLNQVKDPSGCRCCDGGGSGHSGMPEGRKVREGRCIMSKGENRAPPSLSEASSHL